MILVTHSIIGAAAARLFPGHPVLGFFLGALTHFLTDAIPHWHYPLFSQKRVDGNPLEADFVIGKKFILDLISIGLDFAAGIIFSILIFQGWAGFSAPDWTILAGALGAVLPDPLQFLYMKTRSKLLLPLQRFHVWIHSQIDIDKRHLLGITSQLGIILVAVLLSNVLF